MTDDRLLTALLLAVIGLAATPAVAQPASDDDFAMCAPDPMAGLIRPDTGSPGGSSPIEFSADNAESSFEEALLSGNVSVTQGDRQLEANEVNYDRIANRLLAEGGVSYADPTLAIRSRKVELSLEQQSGVFEGVEYYFAPRDARGGADRVEIDRDSQTGHFVGTSYTTCNRDDPFWEMRTTDLTLDQQNGRGVARNITFAIRDVPILYFPYLSFPINNQRQSGFLTPRIGFDSESGIDIQVPYYWNIAPDQDATFIPRIISKRGLQLGGEYRFLNRQDSGEIAVEYLPDDQLFGDDRAAVLARHRSNFLPNFYTDLLFQNVSDDEYLDDLNNTLRLIEPAALERRFDMRYYGNGWQTLARVQDFQVVDDDLFLPEDRPYSRLPQLLFSGDWPDQPFGTRYEVYAEAVDFADDGRVEGLRLDTEVAVSLPLTTPAMYITPRLAYRYTGYQLDNTAAGNSDTPDRSLPIASVDAGLFLERPVDWPRWGEGILSLEPRLFYLYVPYEDQTELPVFDTTEVDRSYLWLFLTNRFTGADRLGDANQLTTALTSRFLDAGSGEERLRASIGQVHYFKDREVTLDNSAALEDSTSELFAETRIELLPTLDFRGSLQWDTDESLTRRSAANLRYQDGGRLVNIAHRRAEQDRLEQVDLAMIWPLDHRWRTMGRWNYSLSQDRQLDAFAGFEYQSCCWALRMLARQHRDSPQDEDVDNSVYLEFEFKGLAGVGRSIDRLLEDAITGYQAKD